MSENEMDKPDGRFLAQRITITAKGRRWVELMREGLTPDEAMRRATAEVQASKNPQ